MLATSSAVGVGTKLLVDFIAEKINSPIFPVIGFAEAGIFFLGSIIPIVRYSREGCMGNGECFCIHCDCCLEEGSPLRAGEDPSNCCVSKKRCLEISKKCCKLTALIFPSIGIAALGALIRLNNGGLLVFPIVSAANLLANGLSSADTITWIGEIEGIAALFGAFTDWVFGWNLLIESATCITPLAITIIGLGLERKKIISFDEEIVEKKVLAKSSAIGTAIIAALGIAAGVWLNDDTFEAAALAASIASVTATSLAGGVAFIGYGCHKIADKFSDYVSSCDCCAAVANCSKWIWKKICCKQ